MFVGLKDDELIESLFSHVGTETAMVPAAWSSSKPRLQTTSTPVKVLQSKSAYSMLIRNCQGQFMIVRGDMLGCIQNTERTTAECLINCYMARNSRSHSVTAFEEALRISTLDGAGSNQRSERGLDDTLEDDLWTSVSFLCESHIESLIIKEVVRPHKEEVKGEQHWANALRHPAGRRLCCKIIDDIVNEWVNICRGPPPQFCHSRLKALLRVCLAGERRVFEKKMRMLFFPNGDPWKRGQIDIWIPSGGDIERSQVCKVVAQSLKMTVFSSLPNVVNMMRWRGLYGGLADFSLQDGLWGIGTELFKRFCKAVAPMSAAKRARIEAYLA